MLTFKYANSIIDLKNTYEILNKLENSYPDFYDWYWNKIIPDTMLGNGQVILAFNKNDLVIWDSTYFQIDSLNDFAIFPNWKWFEWVISFIFKS